MPPLTVAITNSFLRIPHMCAKCPPIGFLHTSDVMCYDFRITLERRSTLLSMMGHGSDGVTRMP
jgi:hypothetical protein